MSFSFDVTSNIPRITQSGTDNNLDGITTAINAVPTVARSTAYTTTQMVKPPTPTGFWYRCSTAGTSSATAPTFGTTDGGTTTDGTAVFTAFKAPDIQLVGTKSNYYMPAVRVEITGTLTNANSQISTFTCREIILSGSANFTSGAWASDGVTPLYSGLHFATTALTANNTTPSIQVSAGTMTLIGGEVQSSAAVQISVGGAKILSYYTRWKSTRIIGGVSSNRFRAYSSTSVFRNCEFYDMAYDLFVMPQEFSVVARDSEYVAQYVGADYGGVNALFKAYALNNPDGSYDFDNFSGGYVELYNCAKGANLNVVTQLPSTRMCTPLFQEIQITAKDTAGAAVQNVRFKSSDAPVDSPQQTFVTAGNLKTWDFRNALSYETTTNASGIALSTPCLHVWYYTNALKKNLRYPSSTASYQGRAYNYKTGSVSVVLGSNSIQDVSAGMVGLDTATTVSEATALANTNINVATQGSGIVIAVKGNSTYQDVWNSYRAYISQFANFGLEDNWTCSGKNLISANASILVYPGITLSDSANITFASANSFRALSLVDTPYLFDAGGVLKSDGVLLTTNILGVQDTYTGTGSITGLHQNSTGLSARLKLNNLANSTVYVTTDTSTQHDLQTGITGSYTGYVLPGTTGTWAWASERYGFNRVSGTFVPSTGGDFISTIDWLTDGSISVSSSATVSAYTTLETLDKLYDFAGYMRTQQPAYVLASRNGTILDFGATKIDIDATAASAWSYNNTTDTLTIKASVLAAGSKFTSIKSTGAITFLNGATATCIYVDDEGSSTNVVFSNL